MKSCCVSTSQKMVPLIVQSLQWCLVRGTWYLGMANTPTHHAPSTTYLLDHLLQPRIRLVLPPHLGARLPLVHHHVGGEVEAPLEKRAADAVGIDRHAEPLELADLLDREAAGDHDLHVAEPLGIQGAA